MRRGRGRTVENRVGWGGWRVRLRPLCEPGYRDAPQVAAVLGGGPVRACGPGVRPIVAAVMAAPLLHHICRLSALPGSGAAKCFSTNTFQHNAVTLRSVDAVG